MIKKTIYLIFAALAAWALGGCATKDSVGIIGGADGPTAVYTATKVIGDGTVALIVVAVAALLIVGLAIYFHRKNRK